MKTISIDETNIVSGKVIDAAMEVHRALGPGLLESVYEACLFEELKEKGLKVLRQESLPVFYKGRKIEAGFRLDLYVEDCLVIELKTVDEILPIHEAQLMTYLKLTGDRVGLLLNFNVRLLKDGIKRVIL
ncbi:MAG TPA: GxxExxY protein [bacterium]|nr:GxxExxY protein [bacterium]